MLQKLLNSETGGKITTVSLKTHLYTSLGPYCLVSTVGVCTEHQRPCSSVLRAICWQEHTLAQGPAVSWCARAPSSIMCPPVLPWLSLWLSQVGLAERLLGICAHQL